MNEMIEKIKAIKAAEGDRLLILGHHYQASEIVALCDVVGDSLELSRQAARSKADRIVFCGVKFMAETADILAQGKQGEDLHRSVYLPAPTAGCPMADMADDAQLEAAWQQLTQWDPTAEYVPIVYVNSSAEVKAFCGRHGGAACTSGNGVAVLKHFLDQGKKIFFAPDQYLCTNILIEMGYDLSARALWRRELPMGGLDAKTVQAAKLVAWNGCCPIHASYTIADVETARQEVPNAQLLIHPEAPEQVVAKADFAGSTRAIIATVEKGQAGDRYLIGTEQHLVERLKERHPEMTIEPLRPIVCKEMSKTTLDQLLYVLTEWPAECRVHVEPRWVPDARLCIERMLAI